MKNGRLWDKLDRITDAALSAAEPSGEPRAVSPIKADQFRGRKRKRGAAGLIAALKEPGNSVRATVVRRYQGDAKADLLQAAGGSCEACGFNPPEASLLHLHHVIPVHLGGDNAASNTILLCPNCHAIAHWMLRTYDAAPRDRHDLTRDFVRFKKERKSA